MTVRPAVVHTRRPSLLRGRIDAHLENVRRVAECAAVGMLWTLFSIPLVTAGAAWIAAAKVFNAWLRNDEEPPLVATFVGAMRKQLRAGAAAEFAVLVASGIAYLDIRFAAAARVPGAAVEMVAVALVAAVAIGVVQLAVARRAHTDQRMRDCVRDVWTMARLKPWSLVLVVIATATCAGLVAIVPALVLLMAGPLGFAVSAVYTRASAGFHAEPAGGSGR
jgi:uncharacterized membrane protein YesL